MIFVNYSSVSMQNMCEVKHINNTIDFESTYITMTRENGNLILLNLKKQNKFVL